jgi:hypothetical protein
MFLMKVVENYRLHINRPMLTNSTKPCKKFFLKVPCKPKFFCTEVSIVESRVYGVTFLMDVVSSIIQRKLICQRSLFDNEPSVSVQGMRLPKRSVALPESQRDSIFIDFGIINDDATPLGAYAFYWARFFLKR